MSAGLGIVNRQWRVGARPYGMPKATDFKYQEEPIPTCADGEILLKTLFLGLAPVMRMYMQGHSVAGEAPLAIGDIIHGRGVARVIESRHKGFQVGDIVQGQMGWQTYKATSVTPQEKFYKIHEHELTYALGVSIFSMTGLSAYGGFFEAATPCAGETVVVSGAAGGVGSIVVQLVKIAGCRVIGIAGGGGEILEAALDNLAMGARIIVCGNISQYASETKSGPANYTNLQNVNGSMIGFFVYNYLPIFECSNRDLARWIKSGQLKPVLDIVDGFENMPTALSRLYDGNNVGVQCCRVDLGEKI